MIHTADDMHDSPVTPAPVGEVLLPCPFCGGGAKTAELWGNVTLPTALVHCDNCGASVEAVADWSVKNLKQHVANAISAWNRRTPPSDTSGEAVAWRYTGRDKEALAALAGRVLYDTIPFTCDDAKQLLNLLERSERERKGHASALAAAEARGLDRAERLIAAIRRDWRDAGSMEKVYACDYLIRSMRSLSPAHKGSENV